MAHRQPALEILVEDLDGSLWVAGVDKGRVASLEIDPYIELVRWGSIYWAKVMRVDNAINAAFVDMGYGLVGMLPASEVPGLKKGDKIGRKIRSGQFVMVQIKVARQPEDDDTGVDSRPDAQKASKVSMDIALQGRFLIYTPKSPGNRISRRIRDPKVRKQLVEMSKAIKVVNGCILRASAAHTQTEMLTREAKIQRAIWESLQAFSEDAEPALLMLGPDALQRALADFATSRVGGIQVADEERLAEATNWCDLYAPELLHKIESRQITGTRTGMGLMESNDLLGQIEDFLRPDIDLKCGGSILFEETALGTMIDVNSGAATSLPSVNHEAADEIARQIRLRNIGGLILIDFAGLKDKPMLARTTAQLQKAFDLDPCTVEIHGPTKTGLIEVTRNRRTSSLMDRIALVQAIE